MSVGWLGWLGRWWGYTHIILYVLSSDIAVTPHCDTSFICLWIPSRLIFHSTMHACIHSFIYFMHVCVRACRYPGEEEYLWVPCSYVQPRGDTAMEITPKGLVAT